MNEALILSLVRMMCLPGKPDEPAHVSFASYVTREMGKAEALLKVVGSRPENLVDNLFTLMPSGSPADFQRILELKVRFSYSYRQGESRPSLTSGLRRVL